MKKQITAIAIVISIWSGSTTARITNKECLTTIEKAIEKRMEKITLRTENLKGKVTEDEIIHLIIRKAQIWYTRNDMCELMEELELDIGLLELE